MDPEKITRKTFDGEFTLEAAQDVEYNFVRKLKQLEDWKRFIACCLSRRSLIEALVAHHVGADPSTCHMERNYESWMFGSFNLCIPVNVRGVARVLFRLPLPYRSGYDKGDEKVRCEAGTYAWLQRMCPSLPTPHLYGFGLSSGQRYTAIHHLPFFTRIYHRIRLFFLRLYGQDARTTFIPHSKSISKWHTPYLVIEHIDEGKGKMLPLDWNSQASDIQRTNLFTGLAQILLSLAQIRLTKIGSFIIDESGSLRLANRPLTLELQMMESDGIPRLIPVDRTYSMSDSYIMDLLQYHDCCLRREPCAVQSKADGLGQIAALTIMRATIRDYIDAQKDCVLTLTDLSPSNLLVDDDWNIKCVLDLEWAASLPVGWQTPSWLTGEAADQVTPSSYDAVRTAFMQVLKQKEMDIYGHSQYSTDLEAYWKRGTFWYLLALRVPSALHNIFYNQIRPNYCKDIQENHFFTLITSRYWATDAHEVVEEKLRDKAAYDAELQREFMSSEPMH